MELTDNDRQRIHEAALQYSKFPFDYTRFEVGAEYATIYEQEKQAQQEIINNNIIEQLQIRVEQDLAKIKKLEDETHDYSAWQSEYRASRAEVERLKVERSEVIRRIKSILKASTVHDKISILEELEQLLNSLKK